MSLLYIGRITKLEIGTTPVVNEDVDNMILMNWERNHDVRPRLYANLKYPKTFQQPHSWIIGSFSLLSDNHTAIYDTDVSVVAGTQYAMVPDGDSNVIDFFQVTYQDEDGNQRVTRFFYALIYRFNKELLNYDDSVWIYHFVAGYAVDAAETPIAYDLVSSDADAAKFYIHEGITSDISTSFASPGSSPRGITLDGSGNLISIDNNSKSVYLHVGVTSTISTSFSTDGYDSDDPHGVTMDLGDVNLVTSDGGANSIYIHEGITKDISTSFSGPGAYPDSILRDLALDDDGNLITMDLGDRNIYIHEGITQDISTSFSVVVTSPVGLTENPGSGILIHSDTDKESIYVSSGVTGSVSTSFSSPGASPQGLTLTG